MAQKGIEATAQIGELYLAPLTWRTCADTRPCVIVGMTKDNRVIVVPISAALPLYKPGIHFLFEDWDSDFSATGLRRTSFAADEEIQELPKANLGRRLGRLEGILAKRFWGWLG